MKALGDQLDEYLRVRRSLGYTLREPAHCLRNFVVMVEREGVEHITTALALRWATQSSQAQPATWAARLGMVRRFAQWCAASDPRTEIPPQGLLPHRYRRQRPYIYNDDEILRIISATEQLPSGKRLRATTFATLFGLLAVTGMRERGTRITGDMARYTFALVSRLVGLRTSAGGHRHGHGPRLHDLRHRFGVRTLLDWYRAGADVERELPKLSTYLGHVHINDTYWYLEAVPELLALATERLMKRSKEERT
ncbi:MAG: integrase [Deltaproteobacteria bacterium]|nr:integrase [Deltaproteobacteria bacterium]